MLSNLSLSDKLCCTVCNQPLFDRDEQVIEISLRKRIKLNNSLS